MSRTLVIRYRTTADTADENQRLVEQVFAELAEDDPGHLRYATFRLADGVTFIHVSQVEGDDNPLTHSAAFAAFQKDLADRCVDGPTPLAATVVGSYRFLTG
jgi:hypothetical protein